MADSGHSSYARLQLTNWLWQGLRQPKFHITAYSGDREHSFWTDFEHPFRTIMNAASTLARKTSLSGMPGKHLFLCKKQAVAVGGLAKEQSLVY